MKRSEWAQPTSADEAQKRAAGRRHYNARRAFQADARRTMLAMLLRDDPEQPLGQLAHDLGVSRATLWRDRRRLAQLSESDGQLRAFLEALLD